MIKNERHNIILDKYNLMLLIRVIVNVF